MCHLETVGLSVCRLAQSIGDRGKTDTSKCKLEKQLRTHEEKTNKNNIKTTFEKG